MQQGLTADSAKARADQVTFGFEPGDIVSEVMSFGSPTPIEVASPAQILADAREHADKIKTELEKIPYLRDVAYHQSLDYPTVPVRNRSRTCRPQRIDGKRSRRCDSGQHFVEPVRGPQLLARSANPESTIRSKCSFPRSG